MKKQQLLKLMDTSGKNETYVVRTDSNSSSIEKKTRKHQKARKRSKSVIRVNK